MRQLAIGLLLLGNTIVPVSAQRPAVLKPANATLPEEFSELTSVRELGDGRVLVTDRIENRIVVADFATGRVTRIGRVGDGPLEYRRALPIFPLTGDKSVMTGIPDGRWTLFDGDRITATVPPDSPAPLAVSFPYGFDRNGLVLATAEPRPDYRAEADSVLLVLVAMSTGRVDTIGKIGSLGPQWLSQPRGTPRPLFTVYDQAELANDGWVAVLRGKPYRVDWRSPDGRWTVGPPISAPAVRMDARERQAYLDRRSDAAKQQGPITNWPATIPPVVAGWAPIPTMNGRLLVRRTATAEFPTLLYDVINHAGVRELQVLLPKNSRIVGFGSRSVYVVTADDNGVEHLTRHPWP